ncbi:MAG: YcaQ family DNA glycosylase [Polyangiaceae bacterium]|nr:YcaQ family DNA glycosylase [Polyangiaceae bacterium]
MNVRDLRQYAIARSLFSPTTLPKALAQLGFVQADPIRAPARAQDWTMFQRVKGYRAGDLEKRYPRLAIAEDTFVNYGFVTRKIQSLMHPREPRRVWTKARWSQASRVQAFIRERGVAHPRDVDDGFALGTVTNWFGGSSKASTRLLEEMHYRGLLHVARRENGIRCYSAADLNTVSIPEDPDTAIDALIDVAVAKYAPLPLRTLGWLIRALTANAAPQWREMRNAALIRAKARLAGESIDGIPWVWLATDDPRSKRWHRSDERVRLLTPFDPVVWDRVRFTAFWGWIYKFEAYTPADKRRFGYYALPLLWRDDVIGWANLAVKEGRLDPQFGYVAGKPPKDRAYRSALDEELSRIQWFLRSNGWPEEGPRGRPSV